MTFLKRVFLVLFALSLLASPVEGKEFCNSPVVRSWETQREATVVGLLKLFFKNAKPEAIRDTGFELLRLEVLLSSCIPPLRIEDFYLLELPHSNPDLLPVSVLKEYLRKHGVGIETKDFFDGKTFWLESK